MRGLGRLYRIMVGAYLRSRLQFRANFLMGVTALFLKGFLEVIPMAILVGTFRFISDYTLYDMAFLFGLWNLCYGIEMLFFSQTRELEHMVRFGILDRYLVRPLSPLFQLLASRLNEAAVGELLTAGLILGFAFPNLTVTWTFSKVLALVFFIALGTILHGALQLLVGSVTLWAVQNRTLRMTVSTFAFSFVPYPLTIFDRPLQLILTFVIPYGMIYFFSGAYLLGRATPWFPVSRVPVIYPAVTLAMAAVSYAVWKRGLANYSGTGS